MVRAVKIIRNPQGSPLRKPRKLDDSPHSWLGSWKDRHILPVALNGEKSRLMKLRNCRKMRCSSCTVHSLNIRLSTFFIVVIRLSLMKHQAGPQFSLIIKRRWCSTMLPHACRERLGLRLRTFALIVCAQPFCAGNATVICHASLRLTGPEDKHGVENAGEKKIQAEFTPLDHRWPLFF